jgi:hypothetical protein
VALEWMRENEKILAAAKSFDEVFTPVYNESVK